MPPSITACRRPCARSPLGRGAPCPGPRLTYRALHPARQVTSRRRRPPPEAARPPRSKKVCSFRTRVSRRSRAPRTQEIAGTRGDPAGARRWRFEFGRRCAALRAPQCPRAMYSPLTVCGRVPPHRDTSQVQPPLAAARERVAPSLVRADGDDGRCGRVPAARAARAGRAADAPPPTDRVRAVPSPAICGPVFICNLHAANAATTRPKLSIGYPVP